MQRDLESGFTLVEMIVVVIIVSILALVSTTQYLNIQQRTADSERQNDTNTLVNALNKYYYNNKEYPRYNEIRDNGPSLLQVDKNALISPSDIIGPSNSGANGYGTSVTPLAWGVSSEDTKRYAYWTPGEDVYPNNFNTPVSNARTTFVLAYLKEEGVYGDQGTRVVLCGKGDNSNTSKATISSYAATSAALQAWHITGASCSNFI